MRSLKAESKVKTVGVHTLSPGMVLTDLLLEGATPENKQIFNILCEQVCCAWMLVLYRCRYRLTLMSAYALIKW